MSDPNARPAGTTRFIRCPHPASPSPARTADVGEEQLLSCDQPAAAEVLEQELVDRLAGLDAVVEDAVTAAKALDGRCPGLVALAVEVEGALVEGHVHEAAGLPIDQLHVAAYAGVNFGGRKDVDQYDLVAPLQQVFDAGLEVAVRQQVGEHDGQARPPVLPGIAPQRGLEIGFAGCLDVAEVGEQVVRVPLVPGWSEAGAHGIGEGSALNTIERAQADVAQAAGKLQRELKLVGLAPIHGLAVVHQQVHGDVLLVLEELDDEVVQPAIDVPIELADVVARHVLAVVDEIHGAAALRAAALALDLVGDPLAAHQTETLQAAEQGRL